MPEANEADNRADEAEPQARPSQGLFSEEFSYWRGKKFPWWATLLVPFMAAALFLYRTVREEVDVRALLCTVLVFEAVVFPAEIFSVSRGHWVYNNAKIWGPKLFGVPIEEPLLYYIFPAIIVVTVFHALRKALRRRGSR